MPPSPRVILKVERTERRPKVVDWKKVIDILNEQGIIDAEFTGDVTFQVNRGGVTRCQKLETIK